ncbi:MAG: acyltransferase family protein [Cyclobacteriaceae bacterium]
MQQIQRLHYIDWLRVLAFGLLFFFHSIRFFDSYPWHIKNGESGTFVNYFVEFVHNWRMQLIFLVSGAGTFFAMRARKDKFVKDRWFRLIVPFVFGVIILIPPQKYFEAVHNGWFEGSFASFLSDYFPTLFSAGIGFSLVWSGHLGYHIWYLAFLFVQTLLFLPLLKFLRDHNGIRSWIDLHFHQVPMWGLIMIPFIILEFFLRPLFPDYLNWADFVMYSSFFLFGYLLQLSPDIIKGVEKHVFHFLVTGLLCTVIYTVFRPSLDQWSVPSYSWQYLGIVLLKDVNSFTWVFAILGLSKKLLNLNNRFLFDLNQGILPFYILHQTVIVIIGFYVVQWSAGIFEKFTVILLTSFVITIGLYQVVWRISWLRFLFGMKAKIRSELNKYE